MKIVKALSALVVLAFIASGCAKDEFGNDRPLTKAEKGAIIGATTGAVVAGVASKNNKGRNALLGAVGGGLAGAAIGNYMDTQEQDFREQLASEVKNGSIQITKKPKHTLLVTMTDQTAFDVNSSAIKPGFRPSLNKIAGILTHYGKTTLVISGHTDSSGTSAYNQKLSEQRAIAVESYLGGKGVIAARVEAVGRGEQEPRASNATEEGRRLNRRVEILIEPLVQESGAG